MIIKATLITLVLVLLIVVTASYYVNKEGFDDISNGYYTKLSKDLGSAVNTIEPSIADSTSRVVVDTQVDGIFLNINANTTDGSTVYGAKILYNSTIPVLSEGQTTDSTLALNLVIPPTSFTVYNEPLTTFQKGFKYYVVSNNITKYIEGTTPLLGSFVFNGNASTPSITSTANNSATAPTRTDVVPEVSVSGAGYDAMTLQQRADLLRDIQKVVRNEILANRLTTPLNEKEHSKDDNTDSTAQGKEYEESCYKGTEYRCPKNPDGTCPPVPDMSEYIKKDAIPCYGCSLDY